jgi:invasion protein IalB
MATKQGPQTDGREDTIWKVTLMRLVKIIRAGTLPAAAAIALLAFPAEAQDAPAEEGETAWVKLCAADPATEKRTCLLNQEIRAENGMPIAQAMIRTVEGEERVAFIAVVPNGTHIKAGIRVAVDGGEPRTVPYQLCLENACYGETEATADFLSSLRRGNQLTVTVMTLDAKPVALPFSLSGFTRTFESEGLDAAAAQQQQNELNEQLQRRAEEARQRLIEQQRQTREDPAGN